MPKIPAYLFCRNKIWYFYYRIPTSLRKKFKIAKRFIRKSLHTTLKREAVVLSRQYIGLIMTDEKWLVELEAASEKHTDLMATGRRVLEDYEHVKKYGDHYQVNDFWPHLSDYEIEAFKYASEVLERERVQQENKSSIASFSLTQPQTPHTNLGEEKAGLQAPAASNVTLNELVEEFIKFKKNKGDWKHRTSVGNEQMLELIKSFLFWSAGDPNPTVDSFKTKHALMFEEKFPRYPRNCKKLYPGKTTDEIMSMIDQGLIPATGSISINTYNEYAQILMSMFDWAKNNKKKRYLRGDNVFVDLKKSGRAPKSYSPFTDKELKHFFGHELFSKKTFKTQFAWRYWVPIIMLYHGMRLEEVSQLLIKNISQINGVWCFDVKDEMDQHGNILTTTKGKGKNKTSERIVPIHRKVIKIGFLKYLEYQKSSGAIKVFPTLSNLDKNGKYKQSGAPVSSWFNEDCEAQAKTSFFTRVGIEKKKRNMALYSLKHTAQTLLINHPDQIEHDKIDTLFGHTIVSTGRKHYGKYTPQTILEVVEKIDYSQAELPWDADVTYNDMPFPWELS